MLPQGKIISFDPISGNYTRQCEIILFTKLNNNWNLETSSKENSSTNDKIVEDSDSDDVEDPIKSMCLRYNKNKKKYTAEELSLVTPYK